MAQFRACSWRSREGNPASVGCCSADAPARAQGQCSAAWHSTARCSAAQRSPAHLEVGGDLQPAQGGLDLLNAGARGQQVVAQVGEGQGLCRARSVVRRLERRVGQPQHAEAEARGVHAWSGQGGGGTAAGVGGTQRRVGGRRQVAGSAAAAPAGAQNPQGTVVRRQVAGQRQAHGDIGVVDGGSGAFHALHRGGGTVSRTHCATEARAAACNPKYSVRAPAAAPAHAGGRAGLEHHAGGEGANRCGGGRREDMCVSRKALGMQPGRPPDDAFNAHRSGAAGRP